MPHLIDTDRNYPPETVVAMTAAFESVCQSISVRTSRNETVRDKLASIILRLVNDGEFDSIRLADVALRQLTGNDRSEISHRSTTG